MSSSGEKANVWRGNAYGDYEVVVFRNPLDIVYGKHTTLCEEEGYETFVVPDDVGGRYSVLTAVGLLPIAAAGIDIDALYKLEAGEKAELNISAYDKDGNYIAENAKQVLEIENLVQQHSGKRYTRAVTLID